MFRIHYRMPGKSVVYNGTHTIYTDSAFTPMSDSVILDSKDSSVDDAYHPMTAETSFGPSSGKVKTIQDGVTDEKTQPLTEHDRALLTAGNRYVFGATKLSPGDKIDVNYAGLDVDVLDKTTVCSCDTQLWVQRREPVKIDGATYNTLVVAEYSGDGSTDITRWQLENGEVAKEETPAEHITWVRETREKATEMDEGQGPLLDAHHTKAELLSRPPRNLDYWMGVYRDSTKIGYLHLTTKPDKLDGKEVFRRDNVLHLWKCGPDKTYNADFISTQYAGANLYPVLLTEHINGDGPKGPESMAIETRFVEVTTECTWTCDGKSNSKTFTLDPEAVDMIAAGCAHDFGVLKLTDGESVQAGLERYTIGDEQVTWNDCYVVLSMLRHEALKLNGMTYNTSVTCERGKGEERMKWQLESGEIVKEEWPQEGVTWVKETKDRAMKR